MAQAANMDQLDKQIAKLTHDERTVRRRCALRAVVCCALCVMLLVVLLG
jgi:hypothetical protein